MRPHALSASLLLAALLLPIRSQAIEILEAATELSGRVSGPPHTDTQFGTSTYNRPHPGIYLLGSFYEPDSREVNTVLGFRVTQSFIEEWKKQGQAQLLFSVIGFASWDPRPICPIQVELLEPNHPSAISAANLSRPPHLRLGSISQKDLELNQLYNFPLPYDASRSPGDILWIGLDCRNPLDPLGHSIILSGDLYLHPGGAPPLLIAGDPQATTQTVQGMSLLQSLNRRFSTPEHLKEISAHNTALPTWVNPLRTSLKMKTLEEFQIALKQQLAKLPNRPLIPNTERAGVHSSIKPTDQSWTFRFPVQGKETSIALYPAVRWNGKKNEVYAFPKRFIITAIPYSTNRPPVTVADWSGRDFPLQGPIPVFFPFHWDNYREVCITVTKGASAPGGHTFALSEVIFSKIDDTTPNELRVSPEDILELSPFWSPAYATDGQTPFGVSDAEIPPEAGTFRTLLHQNDSPQITIHQREITRWSSLEFHPTAYSSGMPPQGFPQKIRIDFSNQRDFSHILNTVYSKAPITLQNIHHPAVVQFPEIKARHVRITLEPSTYSQEKGLLQLEEITVNGGIPLTERRKDLELKLSGMPDTLTPNPLCDRIINGSPWHTPIRRTVDLIRRQILTEELQRIEQSMQTLQKTHQKTITALNAGCIILAAGLLGGIILHQRSGAKRSQERIRKRFQQDLHDEIGSQLSAISLITDKDRSPRKTMEDLNHDIRNINRCAREAVASLSEVIWLTNKEILTLDQCFDVMRKRAQQMVNTINLEIDFPHKSPSIKLSYKTKRNLILLFTEALNNALKHSEADTIRTSAHLFNRNELTLKIHDNGIGFDPQMTTTGIGLNSMKKRASTLNGTLEIKSTPGTGTSVCFTGKL